MIRNIVIQKINVNMFHVYGDLEVYEGMSLSPYGHDFVVKEVRQYPMENKKLLICKKIEDVPSTDTG